MKILILAQTPPPFHGQSIMQQYLVHAKWKWCEKKFIRLDFSKSIEEVGNFNLKKVIKLFNIILKVWRIRLNGRLDILFYPPSGPHKIPFYRDILLLLFIRWCTKKIIFQFHAGGFDILYNKLNLIEKFWALKAYNNPDAIMILSSDLKSEVDWIKPKTSFIIPNGVEDHYYDYSLKRLNNRNIVILTVGMISESKGILTSIEAAKILKKNDYKFIWNFIGGFQSFKIKKKIEEKLYEYKLNDYLNFLGSIYGEQKFDFFSNAHIFCFPSYENEAMPIALLEAMMMSLSIVSTNLRCIPHIIDNNENGLLVPVKDPQKLAEAIEKLINHVELRNMMGINARKKYLKEYTIEKHLKRIEDIFKEVAFNF